MKTKHKSGYKPPTTADELYEDYKLICREAKVKPRTKEQLVDKLLKLCKGYKRTTNNYGAQQRAKTKLW